MSGIPEIPDAVVSEIRRQMFVRSTHGSYAILRGLGVDEGTLDKGMNTFWEQGGKELAEVAKKTLSLGESIVDAQTATLALCQVFGIETGEIEPGKRVITTKCPFIEASKEFGLKEELCLAACSAYTAAVTKSFNPKFSVKRTRAMPKGDDVCEFIWEE